MQQVQLELAKMQAEVAKLQSEAELNETKAEQLEFGSNLNLAEMQSKIKMAQDQLQLRRDLSGETNQIRQSQAETSAATKIATTAMQQAKNSSLNQAPPKPPTPPTPQEQ